MTNMNKLSRIALCALAINLSVAAVTRAANDGQQQFFNAVATGEAENLTALMVPELVQEVDEPILAEWMRALNERLGRVVAINETSRSAKRTFTGSTIETTAEVRFEKGTASSEITLLNGKLLAFDVQTEQLGDDWFQGPSDTQLYQELGASLIRKITAGEADAAYELCHQAVRDAVDEDAFRKLVGTIVENGGELESVTFKDSRMEIKGDSQMLYLNYDVECSRASGTCEVKVQFIGLKGHLMGFNFR